jgi:diguanylate cyclase (GGDEF)-like protein
MYDDKQDIRIGSLYPQEWQQIKSSTSGSISSGNGIFIYTEVSIVSDDNSNIAVGEGGWIVLSYISPKAVYDKALITSFWSNALYLLKEEPATYISVLIISAMSALLIAMRKRMDDRTRFFSEYDVMTKVFNRRAGMHLMTKIYREAQRKSAPLSVCFIDVNGLKEVNDKLGHEIGDELLAVVVDIIKKSMRKTDILARFGGDEFLLILPSIDKEAAEAAWQRINSAFDEANAAGDRAYVISVSHGIAQFKFDAEENIDIIINTADELMYEEKRRIKRELKVLR